MTEPEHDLDWLAFCYAAGDLDAEQAAAFEQLLATNQDARERLAAAVALSQYIAAVPDLVPAAKPARRTLQRLTWLTAGVALLIGAVWLGRNLRPDDEMATTMPGENGNIALAAAWADSLEYPAQTPSEENADEPVAAPSAVVDEPVAEDGLDVPDWMLAALGGEEAVSDSSEEQPELEYEELMPDDSLNESMLHEG
jgi:hypothetical protein